MAGLELRTKLESAKSLKFTNPSTAVVYASGDMIQVEDTIGVVVEAVGTSGSVELGVLNTSTTLQVGGGVLSGSRYYGSPYPNGPKGVLIYEAEKIVLPVSSGSAIAAGSNLYFTGSEVDGVSTGSALCGKCLESIGTCDTQVLADLIVLE
jgi:predicted RecA/RadA family phage recombinase